MENIERCENINIDDFPFICRTCLNKEGLIPLEKIRLLDIFKQLTDIQLEIEDELPTNICYKCVKDLEDISLLIINWKNTDTYLKRVLEKSRENHAIFESDSDIPDLLDYTDQCEEEIIEIKIENENTVVGMDNHSPKTKKRITHSRKRQPSKCDICGEKFSTKSRLVQHQKENVKCRVKNYNCNKCTKTFYTNAKLTYHMRCHSEDTPYQCEVCSKKFRHAANLKRHVNIVHKGLKPFKCEVCGKDFATSLRITEHMRVHTGERPHICNYCGMGFKKYSTRYAHEVRHKIKIGEIPKVDKPPKKYSRKPPDNPLELECNVCSKMFSSKQALVVHSQIHVGDKTFLCNICGKGFLRKGHLDVHVRIHTGERPYECKDCGKSFRQAASHRNHLLIHKGQKSFKCHFCERKFIQLGHLQSHLKTHTGEKPFKCTFCNKHFAQNGNLKAHVRIHTGERPYQCEICHLGFYDTSKLKKHKNSHREEN